MTATGQVFEGTWEDVVREAERFAGKHVRLQVMENGEEESPRAQPPFYVTATPEERARAWREWCDAPRRQVPPLSDEAISRESIYFSERD
jgi:hypothetical protein